MEKVIYGRISTADQNPERQKMKGIKSFIDTCSGSVPFFERPQAKHLIKYLQKHPDSVVCVDAVDRLGRNVHCVLTTVEYFKKCKYILKIENLGIDNTSPVFDLMVSIMGTLAQREKQTTRERCMQGIAIAKGNGMYRGRKKGTTDSRSKTLKKHNDVATCLKKGMRVSEVAEVTKKTRATVYKVKALI